MSLAGRWKERQYGVRERESENEVGFCFVGAPLPQGRGIITRKDKKIEPLSHEEQEHSPLRMGVFFSLWDRRMPHVLPQGVEYGPPFVTLFPTHSPPTAAAHQGDRAEVLGKPKQLLYDYGPLPPLP